MTILELYNRLGDLLKSPGYADRDVLAGGRWPIDDISAPPDDAPANAPVYLDLSGLDLDDDQDASEKAEGEGDGTAS